MASRKYKEIRYLATSIIFMYLNLFLKYFGGVDAGFIMTM